MTEEQKFEESLASIKEIFISLTEKEPTPDDEIDAREQLLLLFNGLASKLLTPEQRDLVEVIRDKLEKWDTLDFWFTETTIPGDIKVFLNFYDKLEIDHTLELTEKTSKQLEDVQIKKSSEIAQTPSNLDVNEIVSEVSERFKGEIDSLKNTIDGLKKELDKKSETINKISHEKNVQKITPRKTPKLAPPVIKIPNIKKMTLSEIQIEKSISPILPKEEQKEPVIEEVKIPLKKVELENFTPIPTKPETLIAREVVNKDLTPIPINKANKKPEIITEVIEEPKNRPIITEKRKIMPMVRESSNQSPHVVETTEEKIIQAFSVEPPKIRSVSVEEVETESIKSSGNDLFNVLSQVGEKQHILPKKEIEYPKTRENKDIKPIIEVKEIKESEQIHINSFIDFTKKNAESQHVPEQDTNEMPVDKDALYQELIALEGKRYAVEKGFKELEASYNKGSIADTQYKQKNDEIKTKMLQITERITTIRRLISSL